jgi:hypothetical protein
MESADIPQSVIDEFDASLTKDVGAWSKALKTGIKNYEAGIKNVDGGVREWLLSRLRKEFDPDQPRDEGGQWTEGGGSAVQTSAQMPVSEKPKKGAMPKSDVRAIAQNSIPWKGQPGNSSDTRRQQSKIATALTEAGIPKGEARRIIEGAITRQASTNRGGPMMFLQSEHLFAELASRGLIRD